MTLPIILPAAAERAVRDLRDLEEAYWMWRSFAWALVAKRPQVVNHHLYAAFVAFRQLSDEAHEKLADVFRQGYAAGVARERMLVHEAELERVKSLVAKCEAEVERTAGDSDMPGSYAAALADLAVWRARVVALEGRTG